MQAKIKMLRRLKQYIICRESPPDLEGILVASRPIRIHQLSKILPEITFAPSRKESALRMITEHRCFEHYQEGPDPLLDTKREPKKPNEVKGRYWSFVIPDETLENCRERFIKLNNLLQYVLIVEGDDNSLRGVAITTQEIRTITVAALAPGVVFENISRVSCIQTRTRERIENIHWVEYGCICPHDVDEILENHQRFLSRFNLMDMLVTKS